jgi:DNA-binding HxlR family transcriptional regulator
MGQRVDPTCRAFQAAIDVLSRPWTGLLLGLLSDGPLRFSELEERSCGVGAKTLSARLKDLEARGIVSRHVESGPPVRVRYALTARGRAFGEVAEAIERWGRELVSAASPPERSRTPVRGGAQTTSAHARRTRRGRSPLAG